MEEDNYFMLPPLIELNDFRGDYKAFLEAVYKLFEEVSHSFKKHHVDYLIDQILES